MKINKSKATLLIIFLSLTLYQAKLANALPIITNSNYQNWEVIKSLLQDGQGESGLSPILDTSTKMGLVPMTLVDNLGHMWDDIHTISICNEKAYGELSAVDYIQVNTNLPEGDYLIEVRGFGIDSVDYLNSGFSSYYGDGVTLYVNGQMVQWLPVASKTLSQHFLNGFSIKAMLWAYDNSFPEQNCIGDSKWPEFAFKFYAYYHGNINDIKIDVHLEQLNEAGTHEALAIQYVKVYRVTLEKVYESDSQFSDFKAYDENGNLNHKVTTISETGENVLGGGDGFGKNAKIELDKTFPEGNYLIVFNYYAFDSWDSIRYKIYKDGWGSAIYWRRFYYGDTGLLYVNDITDDNIIWGMIFNYKDANYKSTRCYFWCLDKYITYHRYPYNWLVSNGYLHELSNDYFRSNWKDRYVTVHAYYHGSINKLIWTSTLDSAGNDESFGIGKVTIYKISIDTTLINPQSFHIGTVEQRT